MKNISWVAVFVLLLSACAQVAENTDTPIVIGVLLPLTGNGADQGQWVKNGIDLANEKLRSEGYNVQLIYEDSKGGNPKEAIAAYSSMKESNSNIAAILTWGSGVGVALTPLVNEDHIVQMGVATATPKYKTLNDYTYRVFPSADIEGAYLAALVSEQGAKKVAIVYTNNDYGVGEMDAFSKTFKGEIVAKETLDPANSDFRTEILKMKAANPDLIFIATYPKEGALFIRQAREQQLTTQMFASTAIQGQDLFTIAGETAEGLLIAQQSFDAQSSDEQTQEFVTQYVQKYGQEPGIYAVRAYDALRVVAYAASNCDVVNGDCLKSELDAMTPYRGVSGEIAFDEYGELKKLMFDVTVVSNGTLVKSQ